MEFNNSSTNILTNFSPHANQRLASCPLQAEVNDHPFCKDEVWSICHVPSRCWICRPGLSLKIRNYSITHDAALTPYPYTDRKLLLKGSSKQRCVPLYELKHLSFK